MNETTDTVLSVGEPARAEVFFDAVEDSATVPDQDLWCEITRIMTPQRNRRICSRQGPIGSSYAPWSEWSAFPAYNLIVVRNPSIGASIDTGPLSQPFPEWIYSFTHFSRLFPTKSAVLTLSFACNRELREKEYRTTGETGILPFCFPFTLQPFFWF